MRRVVLAVLLLCSFGFAQNAAKRPLTFEDMMSLKRIGEPVVSPDGRWVAFSAVDVNLEENSRRPHLWIVPLAGGEAVRLLTTPGGEDRPRFSPDGKRMLFMANRDTGTQVFVSDFDTERGALVGSARKVTNISTEAGGAMWTPDGKNIVFTSEVYADCHDDACNKQRDDERAKSRVKAQVFTRLFYRHWNTYSQGKRTHIFVVPAEGGVAKDLTPGDHDAPPFSLGGQDMYDVSPDGKELAFTSNITEHESWSTNNDIFIVPITGGTPKKISTSPGSDSTPLYSPDGKYIAWRMQQRDGYESDRFRLVIYDRKSAAITNLTEDFDRWVGSSVWAPDSKWIYFSAEDKGEAPIYSVSTFLLPRKDNFDKAGPRYQITKRIAGHNDDLAITPDGKTLLFTRMSVEAPSEIYKSTTDLSSNWCDPAGTDKFCVESQQLTHLNDTILNQIAMSPLEAFWFTGAAKTQVQGFIVRPPNFDRTKKYPVKFLIHGGPQGAWGESWSYRWNPQLFAANGYVVVMINPRGSTGYGQKFIDEINGDWGGKPYEDLMKGLDYVIAKYPFIDGNRVCALGASYGGYMANWLEGHTTRFKCIVSHDGMFNTESAYGETEELWFNEWEFKGTPWTNRPLYRKWSPHLFATNFKTPMLVIHGQLDYRLDVAEGFQLFTTLQRLGVPSKMLYFPDEGHWVLKPQNGRLWYKTVNDWVDQWTKP